MKKKCVHCKKRQQATGYTSGLCQKCRQDPVIRALHPSKPNKYRPRGEPSAEEVEWLVAEGMANLPDWWWKEKDKADKDE